MTLRLVHDIDTDAESAAYGELKGMRCLDVAMRLFPGCDEYWAADMLAGANNRDIREVFEKMTDDDVNAHRAARDATGWDGLSTVDTFTLSEMWSADPRTVLSRLGWLWSHGVIKPAAEAFYLPDEIWQTFYPSYEEGS